MRVLVDLLFFTGRRGGMETYVREVYSRFPAAAGVELVGFASKELAATGAAWFPGRLIDSGISGEDRVAWARGELLAVDRAARKVGADLIHAPANVGPFRPRVPVVLTVHDLLPFRHPEYVPGAYSGILRWMVSTAARRARRIITVSESSRRDIVELLGIDEAQVEVTPLAASAPPAITPTPRDPATLLFIGNRMPHKNVGVVLEALALLPPESRPRFVATGTSDSDPLTADVRRLRLDESVELRAWVDDEELERLYATATAFVLPTRFEGFGLPVLEAMERGCPVICSDLPVLREVAGDAAVYVDTTSATALASAIRDLLGDPDELVRRAEAGRMRAGDFSWERAAQQTAAVLQRAFDAR